MFIKRGIRQNTSPTPEGPLNESERSLLESETLQSQRVNENCNMSLGCDAIRVNETTRGKHLEPSNSVETQLFCNSRVHETTLGGTLSMVEYRDASLLHCTEATDSDSSYYDAEEGRQKTDVEEGRQQTETGSAYVRNTELVNVDCLAPENIKSEQDPQPEIHMIKQWKSENKRPTWSQVAQYCPELKAYRSA